MPNSLVWQSEALPIWSQMIFWTLLSNAKILCSILQQNKTVYFSGRAQLSSFCSPLFVLPEEVFFPIFLCLRKVFLPSLLAQILPPPESFPGLDLLSHLWTQPVCPFFRMGLVKKKPACQYRINGFDPWIWKIPWRRKWQPTPIFLPGKSHGPRSLAGKNGVKKQSDTT